MITRILDIITAYPDTFSHAACMAPGDDNFSPSFWSRLKYLNKEGLS